MSHISIWKLALKNVDKMLLLAAIKALAYDLKMEVADQVTLARNNDFDIAIKGANLPRGIGFRTTKDGGVETVGDSWQQEKEYTYIKQVVTPYINAYRAAQIARNKNPNSQTKLNIQGTQVHVALELNV